MQIINISVPWAKEYFQSQKLFKELQKSYPEIKFKEYDFDYNRKQINYYQVGPMLPIFLFLDNNQEITRLYRPTKEDVLKVLQKFY